jgi:hypothetical protein
LEKVRSTGPSYSYFGEKLWPWLRVDVVTGMYGPCQKHQSLTLHNFSALPSNMFRRCTWHSTIICCSFICMGEKQNKLLHCFFTLVIHISLASLW